MERRLPGSRNRRDRSWRRSARARARKRGAGGADRARVGRRASQEHRLAAGERARAARADRAGRRARAPATGTGDPAGGRAEHARAQHRRVVAAGARRPGRRHAERRSTWPCPGSTGVEHIAQVDSRHFLGAGQWLGRSVGYEHSANGKVFTAFGRAPGNAAADDERRAPGGPAGRLRDLDRRARDRAVRDGGAGTGRPRRGDRGAQHLGPDAADDAGADRGAGSDFDQRGADAQPPPRPSRSRRTSGVTDEEILQLLYDETLVGNAPAVRQGVEDGLEQGLAPERMLYDALIPSLEEVGARFERGDFFVPEMLIAARAMQGALDILRPLLAETGSGPGRDVPDGHRQGRRPRHRQEPLQHHARGRRLPRDRPRRERAAREVHRADRGAQPGHRRVLGVPHDHDADVQGEHQRAREGRACATA